MQEQSRTGVEINVKFFPLAFLLLFCTPIIEIDGTPNRRRWGTHFFALEPGSHSIRIYFRYLFMARCGANSINVAVQEGKTSRIKYYMPPFIFAKGSIKEL